MELSCQAIMDKIDDRIRLLEENATFTSDGYDNQYHLLLEAASKVVNVALRKELEDLRAFVQKCGSMDEQ